MEWSDNDDGGGVVIVCIMDDLYGGIYGGKCGDGDVLGGVDWLDDMDCNDVWFDVIDVEIFWGRLGV